MVTALAFGVALNSVQFIRSRSVSTTASAALHVIPSTTGVCAVGTANANAGVSNLLALTRLDEAGRLLGNLWNWHCARTCIWLRFRLVT
jgi:hypothetical protein